MKSNCLSVTPVETDYGRKTQIHQSSCNMDYSCLKGDCPSFLTVELGEGAVPRKKAGSAGELSEALPEPSLQADAAEPYKVLMVGIGGTGVVTVDALLVTAAAIEGKFALHLDQTGLAQKGGAVLSNLILSEQRIDRPAKISVGETNLLLAFDLLAAVSRDNLERFHPQRTVAVVNTHRTSTAAMVTNVHAQFPQEQKLLERLNTYTNREGTVGVDAEALTEGLFGNNQSNNIFLVGVAYQAGLLPLRAESIEEAIRANEVAVEQNIRAFRWGRKYRLDADAVLRLLHEDAAPPAPREAALDKLRRFAPARARELERLAADFPGGGKLDDLLYPRVADLLLYQGSRLARGYLARVRKAVAAEHERTPGRTALAEAVARWAFKLMAYKDEYEVARLWLHDPIRQHVRASYDGPLTLYYHLHPPLLRALGLKHKLRLGPWFTPAFKALYALRGLRGTPLDPFGYAAIRREERRLIQWYDGLLDEVLGALSHDNHALAVSIAGAPEGIRGYESIKQRTIAETEAQVATLLDALRSRQPERMAG
ncbi:MAG: 2-oxoacid:acceptor oxidoreductase family protein [Candidatus Lambdaproteobacteria bacterium]|nr:2-oxoacid:acceptor oxidoreductase family protein [Candidatus Lambdaproteobacteria bacterium]